MTEATAVLEDVESFRARAAEWLAANMPRRPEGAAQPRGLRSDVEELAAIARARDLQRMLFDGGLAGLCFPKEYGGQGLTHAHQKAFNEVSLGYELPLVINVPTLVPCAAVLVEFGTHEQKARHLPAILRGDELWMQFLSEPGGGSDVAGAITTAIRDGEEWVLNGSKIWTTGAWWSDYGLCLARTDWDVPKHRGLTVFFFKIHQPGIEVHRIEMVDGNREFCQEFITDLRVPDSARVGEVNDGWTVGTRWMFHERNAVGGGSPYISGSAPFEGGGDEGPDPMVALARSRGRLDDPSARQLIGEAHALTRVRTALVDRIGQGMATGYFSEAAPGMARLYGGVHAMRASTIAMELAGSSIAAADAHDAEQAYAIGYLRRQASCIGGGTTEMARNNISERLLGMPRERTLDRDVPFRDVPKGPPASSA
jgi:alkylation response protein AidB-like acyl-CoA dehydrogenase